MTGKYLQSISPFTSVHGVSQDSKLRVATSNYYTITCPYFIMTIANKKQYQQKECTDHARLQVKHLTTQSVFSCCSLLVSQLKLDVQPFHLVTLLTFTEIKGFYPIMQRDSCCTTFHGSRDLALLLRRP